LIYLVLGTAINLIFTIPAAYALSRKDLIGRKAIILFITITMFFSGGLIPLYLVVKDLGLVNKIWAMVIPGAVYVWNLLVSKTFFQQSIPDELHDSGKIDGCNDFRFFFSIVLPLSITIIAVMTLFYGVGHWNAFFKALIYLRSEKLYPLQLILRSILLSNTAAESMVTDIQAAGEQQRIADLIKFGVIIVASVPMLILYPFLQKYFVKGVLIGSIKG
jgi:putative aldouronate transport system permease protein